MKLKHKELVDLLKKAYSAEKAAAFAYQEHAGSVKDKAEKAAIKQIENGRMETSQRSTGNYEGVRYTRFKIL